MSDADAIQQLYEDVILEHSRHPRNRRAIADCSHVARSENPSCGDEVCVFVVVNERGVIGDIAFRGQCCAIATACASVMTEVLMGKTAPQARTLFDCFRTMVIEGVEPLDHEMGIEAGQLGSLSGLHDFPAREKCAMLAWRTMLAALENAKEPK